METNDFIKEFPEITNQEQLSNDVMDSIEAGCAESCSQGCKRKNLKSGNVNDTLRPTIPINPRPVQ